VDLLREAVPGWSRLALVTTPSNPVNAIAYRHTDEAAAALGIERQPVQLQGPRPEQVEAARGALRQGGAQALITLCDPITSSRRRTVVDLAASVGLPGMFETRDYVEDGGLIGYGPDVRESFRRAAAYVDKILKGARPADLPVELPTKFDLAVNLRTARSLGITIPQTLLQQATQVVQ
jgi:putative ABC transport system substrate-binding protein